MDVALETVESLYPFVLTEDQEHLRREIREFAAQEIAPNVMAWDEACEFPVEVVKKLGAMGLLGVIIPPEYGGAGLGYVDYVLAIEELSAVDGRWASPWPRTTRWGPTTFFSPETRSRRGNICRGSPAASGWPRGH